jgi:hypothetical protein
MRCQHARHLLLCTAAEYLALLYIWGVQQMLQSVYLLADVEAAAAAAVVVVFATSAGTHAVVLYE